MSLMEKEVLSYSSPLYGRRTGQIKMKPISFEDFKKVYSESALNPVELCSLVGGVPKYMEFLSVEKDIYETTERNFFNISSFSMGNRKLRKSHHHGSGTTQTQLLSEQAGGHRSSGKGSSSSGTFPREE
ncbi:hypothetical protein AS006_03825 [Thermotoga sp. SG1]|nr:hypothetical protein AS006_03825 [Thermotoga sp. SG1]